MSKKTKKLSLTPEEILARGFRATCRFRAAARFAARNAYWLEDIEEQELGEDVQKNVLLITRKKARKSLLTIMDKAILNKPLENRTEEEKQYLNRVIGNLKCFKKFQNEVKGQLAGVACFYYYGPGRVIVRQGDPAYALYFILTGEVTVSQKMYDPILNKTVNKPLCTMGPGRMFGEVALLHNITRTATISTNTHCELLCLKRSDFEVVLKKTVQQQWDDIQRALSKFTYFDDWDDIVKRECCILARMKMFNKDQTVLGDGYGLRSFVYFILKGKCQVIEHLLVTAPLVKGIPRYKLYVPSVADDLSLNTEIDSETSKLGVKDASSKKGFQPGLKFDEAQVMKPVSKICVAGDGKNGKPKVSSTQETVSKRSMNESQKSATNFRKGIHKFESMDSDVVQKILYDTWPESVLQVSPSFQDSTWNLHCSTCKTLLSGLVTIGRSMHGSTKSEKVSHEKMVEVETQTINLSSKLAPPVSDINLPGNVETHFMQVCYLNPTACFGIGENMSHKRIVAVAPTHCLLIPRIWLMTKNVGNIWHRVQQYLNTHIPSTKDVFREFVNQQKWLRHRKEVLSDVFSKRKIDTCNSFANIPYYIRINEQID